MTEKEISKMIFDKYNKLWLSKKETCNLLGIGATTIYRIMKNNKIKYSKVGNNVKFGIDDLANFIVSQKDT